MKLYIEVELDNACFEEDFVTAVIYKKNDKVQLKRTYPRS